MHYILYYWLVFVVRALKAIIREKKNKWCYNNSHKYNNINNNNKNVEYVHLIIEAEPEKKLIYSMHSNIIYV